GLDFHDARRLPGSINTWDSEHSRRSTKLRREEVYKSVRHSFGTPAPEKCSPCTGTASGEDQAKPRDAAQVFLRHDSVKRTVRALVAHGIRAITTCGAKSGEEAAGAYEPTGAAISKEEKAVATDLITSQGHHDG